MNHWDDSMRYSLSRFLYSKRCDEIADRLKLERDLRASLFIKEISTLQPLESIFYGGLSPEERRSKLYVIRGGAYGRCKAPFKLRSFDNREGDEPTDEGGGKRA